MTATTINLRDPRLSVSFTDHAIAAVPPLMAPTAVVIDDDPDICAMLELRLERAGFVSWTFADGISGGRAVSELHPDVAFIDWMLPGQDGLDICRQIREDTGERETAIVMITARTREADRQAGLAAGCDRFITKPFRGQDLLAVTWGLLLNGQS